jgi:hypothetical protein
MSTCITQGATPCHSPPSSTTPCSPLTLTPNRAPPPPSPANGEVHFVVPGRILLFKPPSSALPPGAQWADGDGERRFSPAFFADLLDYLGVSLVVPCDDAAYDPQPFLDRGIAVEPLGSAGALTLEALDRFLTLARRARGAVAIHCGGCARLAYASELISAYLLRSGLLSDPLDAVSWLAMARAAPAAPGAALDAAAVLDRLRRAGLARSISFFDDVPFSIPSGTTPNNPAGAAAADPPADARGAARPRAALAAQWQLPPMTRGNSAPLLLAVPPSRLCFR